MTHLNKKSKGSSLDRCGGLPAYHRFVVYKDRNGDLRRRVTQIGCERIGADGRPRSKSYKSVYGRTPRRLRGVTP